MLNSFLGNGGDAKVRKAVRKSVDRMLEAVAYKKSKVHEAYNELTLEFRTSVLFSGHMTRVWHTGLP